MDGNLDFKAAAEAEWEPALADAGFTREQARYWLCRGFGEIGEGTGAKWYVPAMDIDDDVFLSPEQKADAESDENHLLHRIALFEDHDQENELGDALVAVVGATLRHELEHARQYEAVGKVVIDLDGELDYIIRVKFGGLPGGAAHYNQKPLEQDANAAAAMYLRQHHPEHVQAILDGPCAHLARSNTPPESPETLLVRTVACLYQYRNLCEERSGDIRFAHRLGIIDKQAEALWNQLEAASTSRQTGQ